MAPFRSKKQQKFAYANPEKFGGKKGLKEWSDATDFSSLPEKVKKKKKSTLCMPIEKSRGPWKKGKKSSYEDLKKIREDMDKEDNIIEFPTHKDNDIPDFMKEKSDGGISGMTTTSSGQGFITIGMGSYPKTRKKKKIKKSNGDFEIGKNEIKKLPKLKEKLKLTDKEDKKQKRDTMVDALKIEEAGGGV